MIAQTSRLFEQRFNVAASRARDRLILVRSVASSDLRPGDLKLALIEHFRSPMKGKLIRPKEVLELCDSDFERDFGKCLLDLGYRIRPQVPVGGYAIDFVVEGTDDRRLAIELDGDKYHGPDRWADDVRRQRALERLGWTFWRCWGSAWISDREGCLGDLIATFRRLGIEPIGTGEVDGAYTEHIEVRAQTDAESVEENISAEPTPAQRVFRFDRATLRQTFRQRSRGSAEPTLPLRFAPRQFHRAGPTTEEPALESLGEGVSPRSGREPVSTPPVVQDAGASGGIFEDLDSIVVEVGDLIFIRYNDQPDRRLSIRLSDSENNPGNGVVHVTQPLGTALLGASLDEEITVKIGNHARTAVIEKIEKPRPVQPLAAE